MTLLLLCSTSDEAFKREQQIIKADENIEINHPSHEETSIYYGRNKGLWGKDKADSLFLRSIVILLCQSDAVLDFSSSYTIKNICKSMKIPVYSKLSDIIHNNPEIESEEIEEDFITEELWCIGCKESGMNPINLNVRDCLHRVEFCPVFKTFEEAVNGK